MIVNRASSRSRSLECVLSWVARLVSLIHAEPEFGDRHCTDRMPTLVVESGHPVIDAAAIDVNEGQTYHRVSSSSRDSVP